MYWPRMISIKRDVDCRARTKTPLSERTTGSPLRKEYGDRVFLGSERITFSLERRRVVLRFVAKIDEGRWWFFFQVDISVKNS